MTAPYQQGAAPDIVTLARMMVDQGVARTLREAITRLRQGESVKLTFRVLPGREWATGTIGDVQADLSGAVVQR